jgi:hypothetical protein
MSMLVGSWLGCAQEGSGGVGAVEPREQIQASVQATAPCLMFEGLTRPGLVDDVRAALSESFGDALGNVSVPGIVIASYGYGVDNVSASGWGQLTEQNIWAGELFGVEAKLGVSDFILEGFETTEQPGPASFEEARALFAAMTRAMSTSGPHPDVDGAVRTTRTSAGGRLKCEQMKGRGFESYVCTLSEIATMRLDRSGRRCGHFSN